MANITQDIRPYDVEVLRNLCTNPNFSTTTGAAQRTATGGVLTPTTIATTAFAGNAVRFTVSGGTVAANSVVYINPLTIGLAPGADFFGSILVRASINVSVRGRLVTFDNADGSGTASSVDGADVNVPAGSAFVAVTLSGTVTAGDLSSRLAMRVNTALPSGTTFDIGTPLLKNGLASAAFMSGATPDTTNDQYEWVGTFNASESIQLQRSPASDPLTPTLELTESFDLRAPARSALHDLLYPGTADATLAAAGPRRGTLVLMFEDQAEAVRGFQMHLQPSTFTLDDLLMFGELNYIPQDDVRLYLDPRTRTKMVLEVPFVEVPA